MAGNEETTMTTKAVPERAATTLNVPGPPPILGGIGNVFRYVGDPVGHMRGLFRAYGPVVALAAGGNTNLFSPLPDVCWHGLRVRA